jgi:hypothetical protein
LAIHLAYVFPESDLAKTTVFVELEAGGIFGEDPSLKSPQAVFLAFAYECL